VDTKRFFVLSSRPPWPKRQFLPYLATVNFEVSTLWHRDDDPQILIDAYKAIGWDCLVIWEDEFDINTRDRVMESTYPYEYEEELREINKA
jgi:hypothetical protein